MNKAVIEFRRDITDSIYDFQRLVLPKIKELKIIDGDLVSIEAATTQEFKGLVRQFDMLAGIDIWQVVTNEGIRGIANRIQWGETSWSTFTIRERRQSGAKTEFEKRTTALKNREWLCPFYTVQSYITRRRDGDLLSLAVAKTEDIFSLIVRPETFRRTNAADGAVFICVPWSSFEKYGLPVKTYHSELPPKLSGQEPATDEEQACRREYEAEEAALDDAWVTVRGKAW